MAEDTTNIDAAVGELTGKLAGVTDQVKAFAAEVTEKVAAGEKLTAEFKEQVDKALAEQGAMRAEIDDIAQKVAQRAEQRSWEPPKTPGQAFIEDEKVKAFLAQSGKARGRVRIDLPAVTQHAAILSGDAVGLVQPMHVAGIQALPERRMTVRDLITPGRTSQSSITYWKETGFTNLADSVSEGTAKPESTITGELVTATVTTIAHIIKASKQILDDAPAMQSHIDGRLRYGLAYEEEVQLLLADGSGGQLYGIVPQATAFAEGFQPEFEQRIDYIRLSLLQSELALFPASGIVLHPTDWARIELTKDAEGRYIFTAPQNETTPRLWGRPLVSTPAMTETKFLTGAFQLGAQIFDREDANVELSTEDGDNFSKNLVTLRGEERLALAVYRPEAFNYGTFQAGT